MNLQINNLATSGVTSDNVFVSVLGTDPTTSQFSYLDFGSGTLVPYSQYKSGTTSQILSKITMPIAMPAIKSARIYFAINTDFTSMAPSGPSPSKDDTVLYDKIEFDTSTSGQYNINSTNVDFYGISFTLSATPTGQTQPVTEGFTATRTQILGALKQIPQSMPKQRHTGNANMYQSLFATDGNGNITRFIAPKSAAYTDWGTDPAQWFTHYLDGYVNNECYKPNRVFSFYDKFYPTTKNLRYGQISSDGMTLNLYTEDPTNNPNATPYAPVPSLPRPSNGWGNPSFPTEFHNTSGTVNDNIDWGFMLIGNVAGSGLCSNWGTDPACMAIMVSICRGVMHLDDGCNDWVNSANYYKGDGSEIFPVLYYSKILHQLGLNGKAYVLSYDDVYGDNPSIFFDSGATVTVTLQSLEAVSMSAAATK